MEDELAVLDSFSKAVGRLGFIRALLELVLADVHGPSDQRAGPNNQHEECANRGDLRASENELLPDSDQARDGQYRPTSVERDGGRHDHEVGESLGSGRRKCRQAGTGHQADRHERGTECSGASAQRRQQREAGDQRYKEETLLVLTVEQDEDAGRRDIRPEDQSQYLVAMRPQARRKHRRVRPAAHRIRCPPRHPLAPAGRPGGRIHMDTSVAAPGSWLPQARYASGPAGSRRRSLRTPAQRRPTPTTPRSGYMSTPIRNA